MNGLLLSSKLNFDAKSLIFFTVLSPALAKKELDSFAIFFFIFTVGSLCFRLITYA